MAMYRYVKENPQTRKNIPRFIPILFIGVGLLVLFWTVWPIVSFTYISTDLFAKTVTPISENTTPLGNTNLNTEVLIKEKQDSSLDYTNMNMWFPNKPQKKVNTPINTYTISIPKLRIENALITVAGYDLSTSLIHYGGTPMPGTYGNTVIFGHSTLPQFYNPTSYKTIFSLLPILSVGDMFTITYDDVVYTYVVYDMVVVEPTDLSPLEQRFDDSYVTLVTCVPPGTYWKRLNVKARLEKRV